MKLFSKARATTRHSTFFQVREAIDRGGCPVCQLSLSSVASYLDSLAYESVNDSRLRDHIRSSRGFCPPHARQFLAVESGPFSIAIIYADVLAEVTRILELGARQARSYGSQAASGLEVATRLAPQLGCPACQVLAESRDRYLSTLVEHMSERDFGTAYRSSQGLCLPHLERAISQTTDVEIRRILIETAIHTLEKSPAEQELARGRVAFQLEEFLSGADGSLMECRLHPTLWANRGVHPSERRETVHAQIRQVVGEECPLCKEAEESNDDSEGRVLSVEAAHLCNLHLRRILTKAQPQEVFRLVEGKRLRLIARLGGDSHRPAEKHRVVYKLVEAAHGWFSPAPGLSDQVCCDAGARKVQILSARAAAFADATTNPGFHDAFLKSSGLCFTHLLLAQSHASPEGAVMLARMEAAKLRGLVTELNEYARKQDYRFANEPWGEEASSPWRAARKMAGAEGSWGVGGLWAPGGTGS